MDIISILGIIGIVVGILAGIAQIHDKMQERRTAKTEHEPEYLRKVKSLHQLLSREFAPRYVSLKGASISSIPREMHQLMATQARRIECEKIPGVLAQSQRIVLLGEPGSGKSTLLQKLLYDKAQAALTGEQEDTPFFVRLCDYNRREEFASFLLRSVEKEFGADPKEVLLRLNQGRAFLLLDGLDELPQESYERRIQQINEFAAQYGKNKFLISCRERDYKSEFDFQKIILEPLDESQIRAFAQNYLGAESEAFLAELGRKELNKLARNPYYLRMLTLVFKYDQEIVEKTDLLVEKFIGILIDREKEKPRNRPGRMKIDLLPLALAHLAHAMAFLGYRNSSVDLEWAKARIPPVIDNENGLCAIDKSQVIMTAIGATLLEPLTELNAVRFYHKILFDYLLSDHFMSKYSYGRLLGNWLREVFAEITDDDILYMERACDKAISIHKHEMRKSGDPYYFHTFAVSLIVAETLDAFDHELVAAAVLHDASQAKFGGGKGVIDSIEAEFGKRVGHLVEETERLTNFAVENKSPRVVDEITAEFDAATILLKLADRVHNMETLVFLAPHKQELIAGETRRCFIPLAEKLGHKTISKRLQASLL